MMKMLGTVGMGALALGILALPARAADVQKDLPGPIDSLQDLQDTGKMLFKLADENNDGQISQKEATDTGNLLVGGFFFRADANGDGTLSKQELQQARDEVLAQKPVLRVLLMRANTNRANNAGNAPGQPTSSIRSAGQGVMSLLDSNNDGQIQAAELRQMVQTSVQSLYAAADTNRDGQLSPSEVNAAVVGAARAAAQASFQKADTDGNGQLSQAEYDKAIIQPANAVFHMLDANGDNQISQQEAQSAQRFILNQIRMLNTPEPANSPRNLLQSGRTPGEVAPVPNFNTGARPAQPAR
jgi:Ca2+-binding EF-hand superfamily protein